MSEYAARCTRCWRDFTEAEIEGAVGCPSCGDTGVPCDPSQDVTLDVHEDDVRVLITYARAWEDRHRGSDEWKGDPLVPVIEARWEAHPARTATQTPINWHELRCLTMWATFEADAVGGEARGTVGAIVGRLARQRPGATRPMEIAGRTVDVKLFAPLTMAGELVQLGEVVGVDNVEMLTTDGDGNVVRTRPPGAGAGA